MDQLSFLRAIKKIAITSLFADHQLYDTLVLKGGNLLARPRLRIVRSVIGGCRFFYR
jgi:hypothetical protein